MSRIRIVTDSTADLSRKVIEDYEIVVVPLKVHFDKEVFLDGINMDSNAFYEKLEESKELPTTSHPTPSEFLQYYQPLVEEGDSIISIHISSKMSETIQSAYLAKQALNYNDIEIFDSRTVSAALGLMVIAAARAAQKGKSKEEIMDLLDRLTESWNFVFAVDTLDHLKRGGRISLTQAFLGKIFNVKPICTVSDGLIYPSEKIRGKEKSLDRIIQLMEESFKDTNVFAFFTHGSDPENMNKLSENLRERLYIKDSYYNQLGPVVGTHAGPNVVGVAVCGNIDELV